jgi:FkbM family methyltransferase
VSLDAGPCIGVDLRTPHGRRLFAYGFCEPAASVLRALVKPGDVVIDGGANIGLFTVMAAAGVGPRGHVIACEPAPTTMALLRANVERNAFDWVELRELALADAPGRLHMQVFTPGSGFSSFAPADAITGTQVEVEVATLDNVVGDALERLTLVKLDVEGAELRALRGASQVLDRARPDFIVELEPDHLERQGGSVVEVEELFDQAGYVGYSICGGRLRQLPRPWRRPAGDPNIVVRPRER